MGALIGIGVSLAWKLLGAFFPFLAPKDPAAEAQKQTDRADGLQSELNAKVQGDAIEQAIAADAAANPGKLRDADKFKLS